MSSARTNSRMRPAKTKQSPLPQARDEAFLDRADAAAAQVLHLHRRVADDGADAELVAARDRRGRARGRRRRPRRRRGGTRDRRCRLEPPLTTKSSAHWNSARVSVAVGPGAAHLVVQRRRRGSRRRARRSPGAAPARRTACRGVARFSMLPACAARRAAAASTSSSVLVGTSVMRLARPGAWPLRPARCSRRATPLAEPICSTRSTGRKSTPRSSDEVATTAFSRPSFRPSSTQSRTSLSSEPWCSATSPAHSGRCSSSSWYQASACERMLTKTSVVASAAISSTTGCCICLPRWPPHEKRPGVVGQQRVDDERLVEPAAHHLAVVVAEQHLHRLAQVAERRRQAPDDEAGVPAAAAGRAPAAPARRACCPSARATRRRSRCAPPPSSSRACSRVSIRLSDSGVVTSAVGKRRSCFARSAGGVSPVRMPTLQWPRPISSSGARDRPARVGGQRPHRREPEHAEAGGVPDVAAARRGRRRGRARRTRPRRSCRSRWWRAAGRCGRRPSPPRPRAGKGKAASRARRTRPRPTPTDQSPRHGSRPGAPMLRRAPCPSSACARRAPSAASPRCRGRRSRPPPPRTPARPGWPPARGARPWFIAYIR